MSEQKNENLTRFLLTFFLGWIGSLIINHSSLKPNGYRSRTLAYFFLSMVTFGIYGLVASICNLTFDPNKYSNIGYTDDPYSYEDDYLIDANQATTESPQQIKTISQADILKKIVVLVMSVFTFFMLFFSLCEMQNGYLITVENGLTFLLFESEIITSGPSFGWAIVLIGIFSILFLLTSFIIIGLSIFNIISKKTYSLNKPIISACLTVTGLYLLIGVIFTAVASSTYWGDLKFRTVAHIPFLIELLLFGVYFIIDKVSVNNGEQPQFYSKATATTAPNKKNVSINDLEKLEKLAELKNKNIITEEEFELQKKDILGL